MPTQQALEYLTKADAARMFRRSERSLSRDITNAIKVQDLDVLEHVRLRLEDGTVRPGSDITIEEIIRLRDEGQNPTWELAVPWLVSRYGRRGDTSQEQAEGERQADAATGGEPETGESVARPELPAEPGLRLAVLEAINEELRTRTREKDSHIRRLETELDRRAQERSEENELQKQNNVLMQQIYNLLSKMQESSGEASVLPISRRARSLPATTAVEQGRVGAMDGKVVQTAEPIPSRQKESPAVPKPPRKKTRRATKRKTRTVKRRTQSKPTESKPPKKPALKHFPTFDRIARSLFGR